MRRERWHYLCEMSKRPLERGKREEAHKGGIPLARANGRGVACAIVTPLCQ